MSDDRNGKEGAPEKAASSRPAPNASELRSPQIPKAPRAPKFDDLDEGEREGVGEPPVREVAPEAEARSVEAPPASSPVASTPSRPPTIKSERPAATSNRPSRPPHRDDSVALHEPRDRFAAGLLVPAIVTVLLANIVGGLIAPGYKGVGSESTVATLERWGTITPMMAAVLGIGATISLVMAMVANPRTPISARIVGTFGAGLVLTFVAASLRAQLEPPHLLVLFAGAFAVVAASAVEVIGPPATRAIGLLFALLALAALLRVGAWGLGWSAAHDRTKIGALRWGEWLSAAALIVEITAQGLTCLYLAFRPGFRGAIAAVVAAAFAFAVASWVIHTPFVADGSGGFRQALQHALTMRVQATSGPPPAWLSKQAALDEIPMLDDHARLSLLPLVFAEVASIAVPIAALASARGPTLASMAAIALAIASRGQIDTPLRAVTLVVAALGALVLSRGARVRFATTARGSERPPDGRGG